jgi:XTP/dITP diphosphohydrolase
VIHTLVFASTNRGKLAEVKALLRGLPLEVVSVDEVLRTVPVVVEDGATFRDNAAKKAATIAAATLTLTLADDSGLEVDALGGRPGVRSARFARERATDAENNAALVVALEATRDRREEAHADAFTARFRCVLALVDPYARHGEGEMVFAEGVCEGAVTMTARGPLGFGYDPLFVVENQEKTLAELSEDEKNEVSHRGRACQALRPDLLRLLAEREAVVREAVAPATTG